MHAPAPRRRPAVRAAGAVVGILALGVAAVGGVVWFLTVREPARGSEICTARLDGSAWHFSPEQAENAALIVGTSIQRGLPARAGTIGLATALQESRLINIDYGDRDSLGLFQQRPSQGWGTEEQVMDPVYSTGAFYDGLVRVDGWQDMEITVAAQAVQRSGFPDAYAQHEGRSRAWASALTGHSPTAVTCELRAVDPDTGPTGTEAQTAVADVVARDLGLTADVVTTVGQDGVVVDATSLRYEDPERSAWATAHWAVATASVTSAEEVRAADQVWTRQSATWEPLGADDEPQPTGRVAITVASEPELD